MSRDSYSICRSCGVFQDNGVALTATCMDRFGSVEEFDAELARLGWTVPTGHPNELIRAFLVRHAGHEVTYWSWDWAYGEDDPLEGLREEPTEALPHQPKGE